MVNVHPEGLSDALVRTLAYRGLGWVRQDPDALADELLQKFPGQQDHVDALVATIASDVLSELIAASSSDASAKVLAAHAEHLVSDWGLEPDVAAWSINAWLDAITVNAIQDHEQEAGRQSATTEPSDGDEGGTRVTGAVSRLRRLRRPANLTTRLGSPVVRPEGGPHTHREVDPCRFQCHRRGTPISPLQPVRTQSCRHRRYRLGLPNGQIFRVFPMRPRRFPGGPHLLSQCSHVQ